ncbi:hypothetical protein [Micromonospora sp. NPDC005305]|uniref:hypothetical protein n=1 Tax=Micromonospora sp. NPDC005305 TaxID=3156875 RepID=UPI0033B2B46A
MLPVAFASSLWTATLRRIARTAVTALALIAGVTGPAATPAADHLHPTATARPAVDLRVDVPAAAPVDMGPVRRASGIRPAADSPVRHPLAAPALAGPPHRAITDASAPVADAAVVADSAHMAAADPGRAAIARRGPPRA